MTLKEDATRVFSAFSLEPVRHTANLGHLFADYAELLCCLRNGDYVSRADLVKRFEDYNVSVPSLSQTVAGPLTRIEKNDLSAAEVDDAYDDWAHQVFANIVTRTEIFKSDYPFELEKKSLRLRDDLTVRQQIYLMLLMCSNLPYFGKFTAVLTTDFEQVAFEALKNFLPSCAIVRQLGKNSDYSGNAQQKITAIANELNVPLDDHELGKVEGNQERGLDVVGWIPFADKFANLLCVLGQCACGKDWTSKLSETRRFEYSYFLFKKHKPIHAMFIPRGLFHNNDFFQSDEICGSLMFDRNRILNLITDEKFFKRLDSQLLVEAYIDSFEEVA